MNRIHPLTSIGIFLTVVAIFLIIAGYTLLASIGCLVSYFLIIKEIAKYTSWFQFSSLFISAIILGVSLEYPLTSIPLLTLSLFTATCGSIMRIMLFQQFSYTRYSWFEPFMLFLAIALYISGAFLNNSGWKSWIFPLPVMIFTAILALGIFKDRKQLLGFTRAGYKLEIGKIAPDFSLPDQNETFVTLSEFKNQRILLLIFVRGDWCPGCHMMLRTYEKNREKFQNKNIMVMAIGPDPIGVNREMVSKLGLDFKVLSDEGQKMAKIYGVQLAKFDHSFAEKYEEGIPLPASFLIDIKGTVQYVSRPDRVGEFLNPALIFPIVESLSKTI